MKLGRFYYSACRTYLGHGLARAVTRGLRSVGLCRRFCFPLDVLALDHASVSGAMDLWSRIHWSAGDGMMPPAQLLAIYRLALSCAVRGDIVELGSWVGLTTSYLATSCRVRGEGVVHAVDTFEGTKEGGTRYPSVERYSGNTMSAFHAKIRRAGVDDIVKTHIGLTGDVVSHYDGGPIRMLLIDADHSYEGVRSDFDNWSPLVADGGLIVFHDYELPSVARFVDGEVRKNPLFAMEPGQVVSNVMAVTKRAACVASSEHPVAPRETKPIPQKALIK